MVRMKCKICGREFDPSEMYETVSGEWICEECAREATFCERCERVIDIVNEPFIKLSPGEYLCESCMIR
jgi:rubredoxin